MSWTDFNNAEKQKEFDIIPNGTIAKVHMTIRPGGYDDSSKGWTGGYATKSDAKGTIYLDCQFTVIDGQYAKRKVWSLIGLHSPKGDGWYNMGRSFIRAILNSAHGISDKDDSHAAQSKRRINALGDLDGIEFIAKIDVKKDDNGNLRNDIKIAITPDHKDYQAIRFGNNIQASPSTHNKPSWA